MMTQGGKLDFDLQRSSVCYWCVGACTCEQWISHLIWRPTRQQIIPRKLAGGGEGERAVRCEAKEEQRLNYNVNFLSSKWIFHRLLIISQSPLSTQQPHTHRPLRCSQMSGSTINYNSTQMFVKAVLILWIFMVLQLIVSVPVSVLVHQETADRMSQTVDSPEHSTHS